MSILSEIKALIMRTVSSWPELRRDLWSRCHWSEENSLAIERNPREFERPRSRIFAWSCDRERDFWWRLSREANPGRFSRLHLTTTLTRHFHWSLHSTNLPLDTRKPRDGLKFFGDSVALLYPRLAYIFKSDAVLSAGQFKILFSTKRKHSADNFNVRKKNSCRVIKVPMKLNSGGSLYSFSSWIFGREENSIEKLQEGIEDRIFNRAFWRKKLQSWNFLSESRASEPDAKWTPFYWFLELKKSKRRNPGKWKWSVLGAVLGTNDDGWAPLCSLLPLLSMFL